MSLRVLAALPAAAFSIALSLALPATADTLTYDFGISGTGISSSGTLTATEIGTSDVYSITGISGTFAGASFSGDIVGLTVADGLTPAGSVHQTINPATTYVNSNGTDYANAQYTLWAGLTKGFTAGPDSCPNTSSNDNCIWYQWDNLLYSNKDKASFSFNGTATVTDALLDNGGLIFDVNDNGTLYLVNLYGDGTSYVIADSSYFSSWDDTGSVSVALKKVPEPASLLLLGMGLVSLAAFRRRAR